MVEMRIGYVYYNIIITLMEVKMIADKSKYMPRIIDKTVGI